MSEERGGDLRGRARHLRREPLPRPLVQTATGPDPDRTAKGEEGGEREEEAGVEGMAEEWRDWGGRGFTGGGAGGGGGIGGRERERERKCRG